MSTGRGMKLGLINSAWAQAGRDTAWGIRKTKEIGFDSIDLFADPLDLDEGERRLIARECDQAGLPIVSICCVALGLVDFNPSVQRFAVDRVARYLDLASEYAARNVLLVLGEYVWQKEVIAPEEQWRWGVENVRKLGEYADLLGIQIALEMEPFRLSLLHSVDAVIRFLDEVACPAVGANIDVSHLVLAGEPPEAVRRLSGRAIHVHLSDCDGVKHGDLPAGRGVVDFPAYLAEIRRLGIEGAVSVELEYSPEPERIEEWVREAYAASDRLMREARLRDEA